MSTESLRILMYSHDGMGIGHVRRNALIASAIVDAMPHASVLLIAGLCEAGAFKLPPRVDCLTVPALRKGEAGGYLPRRLLRSQQCMVANLRRHVICAAAQQFRPHVFIVDKVPRGVAGELDDTLEMLRNPASGVRTRCVLGLRDILDEPEVVRREWSRERNEAAIDAYYDAVWIYGDRELYDPTLEYGWPASLVAKARFAGYLDRPEARGNGSTGPQVGSSLGISAGRRVFLCLVGGGEDGAPLAEAFARAPAPRDTLRVILTGPLMCPDARARLDAEAARDPDRLKVIHFLPDPWPLIRLAERVVTMGGYNCVGELLCAGKPLLIVPRVKPRSEQWLRAERLARRDLADVLHPDELSPARIGAWLESPSRGRIRPAHERLDFKGLQRIPRLIQELTSQHIAQPGPGTAPITPPAPFDALTSDAYPTTAGAA